MYGYMTFSAGHFVKGIFVTKIQHTKKANILKILIQLLGGKISTVKVVAMLCQSGKPSGIEKTGSCYVHIHDTTVGF